MIDFSTIDYSVITPDQMPTETMQDIAEMCSVKSAILLIEHFGGRLLTIPKTKNNLYDEMFYKCGAEVADHIFTYFQGESVSLPTRKEALKLIIHQITINTATLAFLTHYYGVNRSTIYKWMHNRPKVVIRNGLKITQNTIEDFIHD